jgi:hypothetical protein
VKHFHIFGSHAWARIPSKKRKDFEPQRKECIFMGYPEGVNGYRLIDPSTNKLIIERSVKFEESPMPLRNNMKKLMYFLLYQISEMMHPTTLI